MRFFSFQFFAVIAIIVVGVFGLGSLTRAQTVEELQQKIASQTTAIQKLEQEISQFEGDIATLNAKKKTLKNAIAALETTRKKLETEMRLTQAKVDTTDLKIRQLDSDISYKEDEIDMRSKAIIEALRSLNESELYSLPEIALSNNSFTGLWDDIETLNQFNGQIRNNIEALKQLKAGLEAAQGKKLSEKKTLVELKNELNDRKKITEQNKKQTTQLLTQTSNQETQYQKILKQKLALKDALEKELRDYESTLKFILDPTSIPPRGTKVFSAPLSKVVISQLFGKTSSSGRLYASGTHNGVDFAVHTGTPVKAMLDGVVVDSGNTDLTCPGASYGNWILVRHNNGLATLYAHFSLIKATKGQSVSTGDLLGYSGNTGYSTGPHLHVTVFAAAAVKVQSLASKACSGKTYTMPVAAINAYLDPMDYAGF